MRACVVARGRTLRALARLGPERTENLAFAYGMGSSKLARYGSELLALLSAGDPSR